MKILLDECVTRKLKPLLVGLEVFTVAEMGWNGLKNGQLIQAMLQDGFDILLTIDKNLEFQQNLKAYPIILVIFDAEKSKVEYLAKIIPAFKEGLPTLKKGKAYRYSA